MRRYLIKSLFVIITFSYISINNKLSGQSNKDVISAATINNKIKLFLYNNPDSGVILSNLLCNYYREKNNLDSLYISQISLANCYNVQQKNNQALSLYDACSRYFLKKNDSIRLYFVYSGIGGIYHNLNETDKAHHYFNLANQVCDGKKFPEWKFVGLLNVCDYFITKNKFDSLLKYYSQTRDLLRYIKRPDYFFRLKLEYAFFYYYKKQYQPAVQNAELALGFYRNYDKQLSLRSYDVLGLCHLAQNDFKMSRIYFDSALMVCKEMNSKKDYYELLQDIYKLDTTTKNFKNANNDLLQIAIIKDSLYEITKMNITNDLLIKYESEKRESEKKLLQIENAKRSEVIKWQRLVIIIIILFFTIITIALFFYLRHRTLQQKKTMEKDKIDAELKALKAQLNPHFIQNIFQIITNQVRINPTEVENFLQKTANYFRSVLNGTEKSVQSLEDEIIFTEKYLQFQQSLFKNKLTYTIDVPDDVDTFGILVPAMLLQPFIENSVKYGLQLSQKEMNVDIKCYNDDKYLYIEIVDTGNFVVDETIINDKSFGNTLIEKRLNLFYKGHAIKPKLLANPINNNNGFKVMISLPI